jgi:hypothetical protein
MTKVRVIAAILLSVCNSSYAESAPRDARDHWAARYEAQEPTIPSFASHSASRLYQSGNQCGPDRAVPVWGGQTGLLGYSCVSDSANGG